MLILEYLQGFKGRIQAEEFRGNNVIDVINKITSEGMTPLFMPQLVFLAQSSKDPSPYGATLSQVIRGTTSSGVTTDLYVHIPSELTDAKYLETGRKYLYTDGSMYVSQQEFDRLFSLTGSGQVYAVPDNNPLHRKQTAFYGSELHAKNILHNNIRGLEIAGLGENSIHLRTSVEGPRGQLMFLSNSNFTYDHTKRFDEETAMYGYKQL
jgi:hypothetical protein